MLLRLQPGLPYAAQPAQPGQWPRVLETVTRRIEALIRSGELWSGDRLPPEPELAHILQSAVARCASRSKGCSSRFLEPTG